MKRLITILFLLLTNSAIGKDKEKPVWRMQTDPGTGKVLYKGKIEVPNLEQNKVFSRTRKFIAIMDFERVENVECSNRTLMTIKLFENSIRYEDATDGAIVGGGAVPIKYEDYNNVYLTFEYKFKILDGVCNYEFSDFNVVTFMSAPKTKVKGSAFASGGYYSAFGTSRSSVTNNGAKIDKRSMEMVMSGKVVNDVTNNLVKNKPHYFEDPMAEMLITLEESIKN